MSTDDDLFDSVNTFQDSLYELEPQHAPPLDKHATPHKSIFNVILPQLKNNLKLTKEQALGRFQDNITLLQAKLTQQSIAQQMPHHGRFPPEKLMVMQNFIPAAKSFYSTAIKTERHLPEVVRGKQGQQKKAIKQAYEGEMKRGVLKQYSHIKRAGNKRGQYQQKSMESFTARERLQQINESPEPPPSVDKRSSDLPTSLHVDQNYSPSLTQSKLSLNGIDHYKREILTLKSLKPNTFRSNYPIDEKRLTASTNPFSPKDSFGQKKCVFGSNPRVRFRLGQIQIALPTSVDEIHCQTNMPQRPGSRRGRKHLFPSPHHSQNISLLGALASPMPIQISTVTLAKSRKRTHHKPLLLSWDFKNALNYQKKISQELFKPEIEKVFESFQQRNDELEERKRQLLRTQGEFQHAQRGLILQSLKQRYEARGERFDF